MNKLTRRIHKKEKDTDDVLLETMWNSFAYTMVLCELFGDAVKGKSCHDAYAEIHRLKVRDGSLALLGQMAEKIHRALTDGVIEIKNKHGSHLTVRDKDSGRILFINEIAGEERSVDFELNLMDAILAVATNNNQ